MDDIQLALFLLIAGPLLLMGGLQTWRKKRLIENTPCSKVRSAAMGRVEIRGIARPRTALQALLTQRPCCWWRYQVQEYRRNGKNSEWVTVATFQSPELFYVQDETGRILVDPQDAELFIPQDTIALTDLPQPYASEALRARGVAVSSWFGFENKLRVLEQRVDEHLPVYVLGELTQRIQFLNGRRERLNDYLRKAKNNPSVMATADSNRDGVIDTQEWDTLRARLESDFFAQETAAEKTIPHDDNLLIRRPSEGPFILAAGDEASLVRKLSWTGPAYIAGGIAMTLAGIVWAPEFPYSYLIIFGIIGAAILFGFVRKSKGDSKWELS